MKSKHCLVESLVSYGQNTFQEPSLLRQMLSTLRTYSTQKNSSNPIDANVKYSMLFFTGFTVGHPRFQDIEYSAWGHGVFCPGTLSILPRDMSILPGTLGILPWSSSIPPRDMQHSLQGTCYSTIGYQMLLSGQ
jgi:hypothetical protein